MFMNRSLLINAKLYIVPIIFCMRLTQTWWAASLVKNTVRVRQGQSSTLDKATKTVLSVRFRNDSIRPQRLSQFRGQISISATWQIIKTRSNQTTDPPLHRTLLTHLTTRARAVRGSRPCRWPSSGRSSQKQAASGTRASQTKTNPKLPQTSQSQTSSLTTSNTPTWTPPLITTTLSCSLCETNLPNNRRRYQRRQLHLTLHLLQLNGETKRSI